MILRYNLKKLKKIHCFVKNKGSIELMIILDDIFNVRTKFFFLSINEQIH